MCLPDFIGYKQIEEFNSLIGYRFWRNKLTDNSLILMSEHRDYNWNKLEGPHEVKEKDSGIYAYNYYNYYSNNYYNNNYYYNYYNNYNYNNNYNNYYNNYNYNNILGIILQYGKVAIHSSGQRSEYAKIKTLFSIRESDAQGSQKFLNWIKIFNKKIEVISKIYEYDVISWQDYNESVK